MAKGKDFGLVPVCRRGRRLLLGFIGQWCGSGNRCVSPAVRRWTRSSALARGGDLRCHCDS